MALDDVRILYPVVGFIKPEAGIEIGRCSPLNVMHEGIQTAIYRGNMRFHIVVGVEEQIRIAFFLRAIGPKMFNGIPSAFIGLLLVDRASLPVSNDCLWPPQPGKIAATIGTLDRFPQRVGVNSGIALQDRRPFALPLNRTLVRG